VFKVVDGLMINVFNNAKKLTLSAWSWPSREVANMISGAVDVTQDFEKFYPSNSKLQYVTPTQHNNFLSCIVLADKTRVKAKIESSLALSLRCDSSVDRRRIDNCHVLAKIINQDGKPELLFLGLDEPKARGMPGYVQAVKDAVNLTSRWSDVARKMTSIVTDGTNLNTGDRTSLWASLTAEHEAYGLPLVKVLCIAHRPDLAWKAVSDNVSEVKFLFSKMVVIASYFHSSGVRPRELREVAEENGFQLRELPKLFEVRWSEFNSSLLQSVLVSWRALVKYFEKVHDATSQGYYAFLTKLEHLKLLVFVADLLFVFSRYHKKIQLENFNITDLPDWKSDVIKRLDDLYHSPVLGGWESEFEKQHQPEDNFLWASSLKARKKPEENNIICMSVKQCAFSKLCILAFWSL
jgi:hypothetical protein